MITLNPDTLFGKGLHRECFIHPDDKNKCIKVVTNGNQQETEREQGYYRLLEKNKISWDMLPRFYGNIDTDMGSGAVFELIRDSNGQVSKTLEYYLADTTFVASHREQIHQALAELKTYLLRYNIITMPIKSKNVLFRFNENNQGRLYIIDNIGNANLITIESHWPFLGRKKIIRRWDRFIKTLTTLKD